MKTLSIAALLVCVTATAAYATPVTYTVDPTLSVLTASGNFAGVFPINPQSVSSLVTSYFGTITADRNIGLNTLLITGGTITANNSGSYLPGPTQGNYGTLTGPVPDAAGFHIIDGAVRNFAFSPTSSLIAAPAAFNSNLLSGTITSGQLDYADFDHITSPPNIFETDGSTPINGGLVFTAGSASLIETPSVQTLTIPIDTDLTVMVGGSPLAMHLSGTIVAVAPEPTSLTLLAIPALLMLRRKTR